MLYATLNVERWNVMGRKKYFISKDDESRGPYSKAEILARIDSGELSHSDSIYDEVRRDWVLIMQFPDIMMCDDNGNDDDDDNNDDNNNNNDNDDLGVLETSSLEQTEVSQKEGVEGAANELVSESIDFEKGEVFTPEPLDIDWYVLKGDNKFGPFSFKEIIKMLQEQTVLEFDFVWHPSFFTWKKIAEVELFSPENLTKLKIVMPEINKIHFRRRHRRVRYKGTVLIHDNEKVWKAQGVEISTGGAKVNVENSEWELGDILNLHFQPTAGVPPFNAICEIVSKTSESGLQDLSYGLKFTSVNSQPVSDESLKRKKVA